MFPLPNNIVKWGGVSVRKEWRKCKCQTARNSRSTYTWLLGPLPRPQRTSCWPILVISSTGTDLILDFFATAFILTDALLAKAISVVLCCCPAESSKLDNCCCSRHCCRWKGSLIIASWRERYWDARKRQKGQAKNRRWHREMVVINMHSHSTRNGDIPVSAVLAVACCCERGDRAANRVRTAVAQRRQSNRFVSALWHVCCMATV